MLPGRQRIHRRGLGHPTRVGVLVGAAVLLAACVPVTTTPPPTVSPPTVPPPTVLKIGTNPLLYPAFDTSISDYVARCGTDPVTVSVEAPKTTKVSVNGTSAKSGRFTKQVQRSTGQRFTITVQVGTHPATSHNVRCLPTDFVGWTSSLTGPTQAEWYLTTPGGVFITNYAAIFDVHGAPVWWSDKIPSLFVDLLPDNTLLEVDVNGPLVHQTLDGTVLAAVDTANALDLHDGLLLSSGHYLVVDNVGTLDDFSSLYTLPDTPPDGAEVLDHVFQALDSSSNVVWSWTTSEHIDIAETGAAWRPVVLGDIDPPPDPPTAPTPGDAFHWNSVEETDDAFIFSMRHEDAIYKVAKEADGSMGEIVWKLGGVTPPLVGTHLTIEGDPEAPNVFGGQHDARWDPATSSLTLFDNGTARGRPPRAVRYVIDELSGKATFVESITSTQVPQSPCCGSTRRLAGGNWVTGWGGSSPVLVTEQEPDGTTVFTLDIDDNNFMYRAIPIPFGQLDRATLIAAMDARNA